MELLQVSPGHMQLFHVILQISFHFILQSLLHVILLSIILLKKIEGCGVSR